jgi:hypothetical protein
MYGLINQIQASGPLSWPHVAQRVLDLQGIIMSQSTEQTQSVPFSSVQMALNRLRAAGYSVPETPHSEDDLKTLEYDESDINILASTVFGYPSVNKYSEG